MMKAAEMIFPLSHFPFLQRRATHWVPGHLTKDLLVQLLSSTGQPTLTRVLLVPDLFYFTIIEATLLLGTLNFINDHMHFS